MKKTFGQLENGENVDIYSLKNNRGMKMKVITYGGIITSLYVPDKNGNPVDVVLGYDNLEGYVGNTCYFGALIGRYGNRIGDAKFILDGKEYQLAKNDNGKNHLHGGIVGYNKVIWNVEKYDENSITLSYLSKDGEEGYPGNLKIIVTYTLNDNNELVISYDAETDKPTVCNLTQHTYFNLDGHNSGDVLNHKMLINANHFTPTDVDSIPTGEIKEVAGTDFDFKIPTEIGARINNENEQLIFAGGYDHNWCLNKNEEKELSLAATTFASESGIVMDTLTTEPGVQFYTGNYLDGKIIGKDDAIYNQRNGFCLETQHYPDSPNHHNFPSTVLNPDEKCLTKTVYKFY